MNRARTRRQAHVHGALLAIKRRGDVGPVSQLPGFEDSLRLLIERERYSLYDIGLMFGVSRERIRQLADRHGLLTAKRAYPKGLRAERVWNDTAHRFEPVSKGTVKKTRERKRIESVAAIRKRVRAGYLAHLVAVVHDVADANPERRAGLREVGALLWPDATPEVQAAWTQNMARSLTRSRTNAEGWAAICQIVGAAPALRGSAAHRNRTRGQRDVTRQRHEAVRELRAEGVPDAWICWAVGIGRSALWRYRILPLDTLPSPI